MNLKLDWGTVAKAVKGTLLAGDGNRPFDSFETDSRKIAKGQTFWALKGKNYDAHMFLEDTLKNGASGWIIEKGRWSDAMHSMPGHAHVIEVSDTLKALGALAAFHRRRFDIPLAAITGSNGKSTTKEMLACICAQCAGAAGVRSTCYNPGSLNNQFGLPLSILELETGRHAYGVFELGASRKGDIREIAGIACPTVGVLTNIAPTHLEFFGDMETIYRTKTELLEFLQRQGTLVYNADDPFLSRLDTAWKNCLTFGFSKTADVIIVDEPRTFKLVHKCRSPASADLSGTGSPSPAPPSTAIPVGGHTMPPPKAEGSPASGSPSPKAEGTYTVRGLPMRYDRLNAAGAAAAALAMGIGWENIISGLEKFRPLPMRMQAEKRGNAAVFLDAYNANPESMRAAVSSILEQNPPGPVCVILGDMKELGDSSGLYHKELGSWLAGLGLDRIFLAGTEMKAASRAAAAAGAAGRLVYAGVPEDWMEKLREQLKLGGTYLIKASRAMQFEKILDKL